MLYLLALRQVSALNWGTPTRHASSYTTPLRPTMPVLTLYHRVRVHMPTGDLSHEMNLMTYPDMREDNMATGPHEVQLQCRPFSISTCGLQEGNMAIGPHGVQLHCRPYPLPWSYARTDCWVSRMCCMKMTVGCDPE